MTKIKCPFCQQELEIGGVDGVLRGCPKCRNLGTEMLWQALIDEKEERDKFEQHYKCLSHVFKHQIEVNDFLGDEANKLQKKLDIAVKALNKIANTDIKVVEKEPLYYARAMFSVTNNALNRIQNIEQTNKKEETNA